MIYRSDNEQGFTILANGNTARTLRDFEGLTLVVH
jgi:hypothetical protein